MPERTACESGLPLRHPDFVCVIYYYGWNPPPPLKKEEVGKIGESCFEKEGSNIFSR